MSSHRNKRRRQQREEREAREKRAQSEAIIFHESPPAVLRLVRSEGESVPAEPIATGLASETVSVIPEPARIETSDGTQAGSSALASAVDAPTVPRVERIEPVRIRRSFDANDINPILNDPSIFPFVSIPGMDHIDVAPVLADERNILLMADGGGILCCWVEPGAYEIHTNFLKPERGTHPERGPYIRNACLAAYRWMFTRTECTVLLTKIPAFNRAAAIFAPLLGWVKQFERKAVWPTKEGLVDQSYWALSYNDWVRKTPELVESGHKFHDRLREEFLRHGHAEEQHPDDECHDIHVGACAEMIFGGQPQKAVALYNAWARFAEYGQISLISEHPTVIDIGNALLQITGDTFKVVMVR